MEYELGKRLESIEASINALTNYVIEITENRQENTQEKKEYEVKGKKDVYEE